MAEPERRRRRTRHPAAPPGRDPEPTPAPTTSAAPGPEPAPAAVQRRDPPAAIQRRDPPAAARRRAPTAAAAGTGTPPAEREAERGLRGLVGSGSSQVSPAAAMRARDAARPSRDDLAAAERDVVVIRRNWVPREDLPRGR